MKKKRPTPVTWTNETESPEENPFVMSPEVGFQLNPKGEITDLESQWLDAFGYNPKECIGKDFVRYLHQEDQDDFRSRLAALVSGEKLIYSHQLRFLKSGGKSIWVEVFARPLKSQKGEIIGVIGTVNDISQRKAIARNAEERNQIIFSFFEDSPHMMAVAELKNNQVHFLFCNLRLRNHLAEEVGSQKIMDVVGPNWSKWIEESKKTHKTVHFEYDRETKKGPRHFACSLTYIGPGANPGSFRFSYTVTDLTENKTNEKLLEEQKAKLVHAAKMSSLGEMASGIAHEVNNPLAIIQGSVQLMRLQLQVGQFDAESFLEKTSKIEATVGRISKIISSLRTYARDGNQDPMESCSVDKIIQDTMVLCQNRFSNHNIDLRVQCPENLKVLCRPVQISQILINLLNNAFDAVSKLPEKWVSLEVLEKGDEIHFVVRDSGKGIPKQIQDKMMTPFFTTKEVGQGTGLGLSLSKSLIEGHQGNLFYESKSPHTCFILTLPLRRSGS